MPTTSEVVRLREWTPTEVECDIAELRLLRDVFKAEISPARASGDRQVWRVRPSGIVGIARTDEAIVVVRPRIPVANVLTLAGASATPWTDDEAPAAARDDVHLALARLFVLTVERTLTEGVLRGYREQHDDLLTVRGRIDLAEQIRRRPGRNLPLAVNYQEHDEDVLENRVVKAAASALQRLGLADGPVQRGLHRILMTLQAVSAGASIPSPPQVHWTRMNERYRPAVELARLVLDGVGVDVAAGGVPARSLTIDMPRVFEDFLARELGKRLEFRGGVARPQDTRWWLDTGRRVSLRPDLVWDVDGAPVAVIDAKYQTVGPRDTHGDNTYQLLAYCTALGLPDGHLVYANLDGSSLAPVQVVRSGPRIHLHAFDLCVPLGQILEQVDALADRIARTAAHGRELHPERSRSAGDPRVLAP